LVDPVGCTSVSYTPYVRHAGSGDDVQRRRDLASRDTHNKMGTHSELNNPAPTLRPRGATSSRSSSSSSSLVRALLLEDFCLEERMVGTWRRYQGRSMVSWLRWYLAPVACLTPLTGCPQSATVTKRSFLLRGWTGFSSEIQSSRNGQCGSAMLSLFHGLVAARPLQPWARCRSSKSGPSGGSGLARPYAIGLPLSIAPSAYSSPLPGAFSTLMTSFIG
jgi:hypothetical protein